MVNQYQEWHPILPYPSRTSVAELFVAMIVRSSGVVAPRNWEEDKLYFLRTDVEEICEEFRDEINAAFTDAQSAIGLSNEQASLGRQIAKDILARLDSEPESQHTLNAIRIVAIERYRERRIRNGGQFDDAG